MDGDLKLQKSIYFTAIDGVASFPEVMTGIRDAIADPKATPASVARAVERDVAFASRLLRLVNSPAAGLLRPCGSLPHAVALVGLERIGIHAETVASLAALQACTAVAPELTARAAFQAAVARQIAVEVKSSPEHAYTAALLVHIGAVAIYVTQPGWQVDATRTLENERERIGLDHAELGGDILRRWNLPAPIPTVVEMHHDLAGARAHGSEVERLVAILQLAEKLAPFVQEEPTAEEWDAVASEPAARFLDLDAGKLAAICREVEDGEEHDARFSGVAMAPSAASLAAPAPRQKSFVIAIAAAVAIPAAVGYALFSGLLQIQIH